MKESKVFSLKSMPSVIALLLSLFGFMLTIFTQVRWLYLVIPIGFGYYVFSSLNTFTQVFSKKLQYPKKSARNILITISIIILTIIPVVSAYQFYEKFYISSTQTFEIADIQNLFPSEVDDSGVYVIPLETATIMLYFVYLFVFDFVLPLVISFLVLLTSFFAVFARKKK